MCECVSDYMCVCVCVCVLNTSGTCGKVSMEPLTMCVCNVCEERGIGCIVDVYMYTGINVHDSCAMTVHTVSIYSMFASVHVYDSCTSSGNAHMYTLSYRSSNDEQASICIVSE